MLMTYYFILVF